MWERYENFLVRYEVCDDRFRIHDEYIHAYFSQHGEFIYFVIDISEIYNESEDLFF